MATAGVALGIKAIDLKARNAERRHEVALDLSTRMWDAKRAALEGIIGSCVRIRQACQQHSDSDTGAPTTTQRTEVIRTLAQEGKDLDRAPGGRGALIAWTEEPTRQAVERLLDVIDTEVQAHGSALGSLKAALQLQNKAIGALPEDVGNPETRKRIDDFKTYNTMVRELTEKVGSSSRLDLKYLATLCDNAIREAREDLRGRYGPAVGN